MTCGPLVSSWATSLVTSIVPRAQLVLVAVPALESIVVVPAAVQFQVGAVGKLAVHCVASTLTDGGSGEPACSQPFWALPSQSSVPGPQVAQAPPVQVWLIVQAAVVQLVPQVVSRLIDFSQPFEIVPSHSLVPAPHVTHAPPVQVSVCAAQATVALQVPLALQVWTPLPEHCFAPGTHTPVQAPLTHAEATHVVAVPQAPLFEQVCTPLLEHEVAPGAHTPVHAPPTQALFEHGVTPVQVPDASQV